MYIPSGDPIHNPQQTSLNSFPHPSPTHTWLQASKNLSPFLHSKINFKNTSKKPSFSTSAINLNRLLCYPPTSGLVTIPINLSLRPLSKSLVHSIQILHHKERPRSWHRNQPLLLHKSQQGGERGRGIANTYEFIPFSLFLSKVERNARLNIRLKRKGTNQRPCAELCPGRTQAAVLVCLGE